MRDIGLVPVVAPPGGASDEERPEVACRYIIAGGQGRDAGWAVRRRRRYRALRGAGTPLGQASLSGFTPGTTADACGLLAERGAPPDLRRCAKAASSSWLHCCQRSGQLVVQSLQVSAAFGMLCSPD